MADCTASGRPVVSFCIPVYNNAQAALEIVKEGCCPGFTTHASGITATARISARTKTGSILSVLGGVIGSISSWDVTEYTGNVSRG